MQPSQEYYDLIDSYKVLHEEEGKFKGISLAPLVPTLIHVTKENNCKTLLDYGCGKAIPYDKDRCKEVGLRNPVQELCNIESFDLYDPAYEKYAELPDKKYDIVVCTDVLEHVPEEDLGWVADELIDYAKKLLFLNISCIPALKKFRDGTNVHVSLFKPEEWANFLAARLRQHRNVDLNIVLYADHKVDEELRRRAYKITYFPTIFQLTED